MSAVGVGFALIFALDSTWDVAMTTLQELVGKVASCVQVGFWDRNS